MSGSDGNLSEGDRAAKVTLLLDAATKGGTGQSAEELMQLVYDQLRAVAQQHVQSERSGHTLSATALVHEVYLKLVGPRDIPWQNRGHFYAAAVEAMRRILLDHAKARGRKKRGGGMRGVDFEQAATLTSGVEEEDAPDYAALDEVICRLAEQDERMATIVRLRFFAGLSAAETAESLGVSERTVKSDWSFAKSWLARELRSAD